MIGAAIGSFLNVVIYRTPRGMSLSEPKHSFCPKCRHQLGPADLVPLFSWLVQGGRCRYCAAKVSPRYFFVELITGGIWAGIWYQYLVASWDPGKAVAYALAAATLVAIIFIDLELYVIPDQINAFLWAVGVGYNAWLFGSGSPEAVAWIGGTWGLPSSLVGWFVGVGTLWGIAFLGRVLFRKDAMGHGDIKMARGVGAVLFAGTALMSFALAVVLGAVLGIAQVLAKPRIEEEPAQEPAGDMEPESIGSLVKCGVGYLLLVDIVGLFAPKLYEQYFGEAPFEPLPEEDEWEAERTMIPFGPYLALGAIGAAVFQAELGRLVEAYTRWAFGS